jgi:ubiquinone/menaquinone biosynthesis C-methylase UbiE
MTTPTTHQNYVMGHTDHERRRLSLQASIINPLTDSFLRSAGVSAGMHVLELGCGVGEVSLIAARLVGPRGSLHCIDIDAAALEIASARARSAGHNHVRFECIDAHDLQPERPYDAVIGRHILLHMPDAPKMLRKAVSLIHTGGLAAFQELDLSFCPRGFPEMPLMFQTQDLIIEFFKRAVARPRIGPELPRLMQEAGLATPECRAECSMDGGPHSQMPAWMAETVRSLLPRMEALGLAKVDEVSVETLEERLRAEVLEKGGFTVSPLMFGAFARKP